MPRANSKNAARYNRNDDAKRKAAGWVRGPRIRREASEHLQLLAFRHKLTPSEVASRLILGEPLTKDPGAAVPLSPYEQQVMEGSYALAP